MMSVPHQTPDAADLRRLARFRLDGKRSPLDMVHGVAELIATISAYVELLPGDIIATGSPPGVGFTRRPPQFPVKGDVIRAELVGFMSMQNEVQ